ncbi:MAG TPA: hypothetical protein VGN72_01680 [Tepidisphaeraceae bacterium]|jgi:hypothetical protein|nr:hypothetical protein [Tepidisphaeraceae bacterium]
MTQKYFTQLGHAGVGQGVNRTPASAVKYTHDIFSRAADEKLDVYMLCGSLCAKLRDDLYSKVTGRTFADSLRGVLSKGRNVSIFIWGDPADCKHSPECDRLIKEMDAYPRPTWGTLDVRSSGTNEDEEKITHFIIAKSRDDGRWILRVEQPHPRMTVEQFENGEFEVPAAIFFDTAQAKEHGRPLLTVFNDLFDAAGKADQKDHNRLTASV